MTTHRAVLPQAVATLLEPAHAGQVIVDATVGQGGHSALLGEHLDATGRLIGLDVDEDSLAAAQKNLAHLTCGVTLVRSNFDRLGEVLDELGIAKVDRILADLGWCTAQVRDADRGVSFQLDGPLDMRLDTRLDTNAADLIHTLDEKELADVIYRYGEERKSRRIAKWIAAARREKRIERTGELAELICRAVGHGPKGKSRIHPATRTFQALRIAVNDELGCLERLLAQCPGQLAPDGRVGIISFHSLEDRMVKWDFKAHAAAGDYTILTKKPLIAADDERHDNPPSRSAKFRVAQRSGEPGEA